MATRQNLCIVPALKVDDGAPGAPWNDLTPGDWARTASAHASLPRSTAFAGTTATNLICSLATGASAGKYYVVSVSVRAVGPQTGVLNIDWKTSGNVFISTTNGAGSDYGEFNLSGSSTTRVAVLGQAPTNTARVVPVLAGMDAGGAQATACMIREFDTLVDAEVALELDRLAAEYFDGDSDGASWDGADGESTSTIVLDEPPQLLAELPGPSAVLTPQVTITAVELTAALPSPAAAIGLLVSALYDDRRGRIRVSAQGLAATVVRAVVSHRKAGTTSWSEVRGGRVPVVDAAFARTVDDYEFSSGATMEYRIQGLSTQEGEPDAVVQTRIIDVGPVLERVWIKFIARPFLNRRVELVGWSAVRRRSRAARYDVAGAKLPVVTTDKHLGREFSVDVAVHSVADRDTLDNALSDGVPIFLHTPSTVACPTIYASVGDYEYVRPASRSRRSIFTIPLVEIAAPPPSVVGVGLTYAVLATQAGTYADIPGLYPTYADMG
jgi:hypothetical protein